MSSILDVRDEPLLHQVLTKCNWDVNTAVSYFFDNNMASKVSKNSGSSNGGNSSSAASLFAKYKGPSGNMEWD